PPPPPSPLAAATAATAAPSCSLELPELPRRRNSDTPVTVSLQLEVSNHPPELLASLNALRCEAAFTDVALEADTCTLHAHRALLAAASPYFRAMFSSQFKEGAASTVSVTSVSGETLRLIVEYVYTSKIEITTDNVQDLTVGCKLLHFPLILHQCVSFLMHHLDSTNAVTMEQFAAAYDFVELREEARQRVLENFASLAESNELAELTLEQLTGCLQSDDLFVRSEDEVARAVLRWVGHRPVERSQHLSGLLLGSRLSCLSREFIQSELLPSPLLRDFSSELLTQLTGHLSLEESPDATPRPSTLRREQLVVLSHDYLEAYNPAKDKWCRIAFPAGGFRPTARDSAVCVLENEIWLTGGVDSQGRALPDVVRYSPLTNAWSEGPPLLSARSRHTCVCVRGSLLVMGGVGLDGRMCTGAEVLRLRAGGQAVWEPAGQLPEHACRKEASATALSSSCLIEVGGVKVMNGNTLIMNTLDQHLVNDKGVEYTGEYYVLPEKLRCALLAVIDNLVLILSSQTGKFWCLEPMRKSVRSLPALRPEPTQPLLCATVCDRRLYCVDRGHPHSIAVFDPESSCWSTVRPPKLSTEILHCVTLQL
ncbi:hypothetical protein BOX15_Mlig018499g4, partial [Macrostomum lignano]